MVSDAYQLARLESLVQDHKPIFHGKLGAKPRDFRGNLTFESYITSVQALPNAPAVADRESGVETWPMYGNDTLGDCTVAGMFHSIGALTAYSGQVKGGALFSDAEAVKVYSAVSGYVPGQPDTDNGATLQSVCQYMAKTGAVDVDGRVHKLAAWAEVGDPTNLPLLKKILNTFGTVYLAYNLPQSAEDQFDQGEPFTYVPGSPSVGGHCMSMQLSAVGPKAPLNDETLITWAREEKCNQAFMSHTCVEAIVLVSEDWITNNGTSIEGLNLNQLIKDSKGL